MVNVLTIPERLEDPVRKSQHQQVLNGLFAEVVIDAEDLPLAKCRDRDAIELSRRLQIATEWLLDDDARVWTAAFRIGDHSFRPEELGDLREELRRNGEVVDPSSEIGRAHV